MIPKKDNNSYTIITYPSNTYKLNENNRIYNYIDGLDAIRQAVYKILNTSRYAYLIYSWNYGFEVIDLIGEPYNYVILELKNRITEALMQDDRIIKVKNFSFKKDFDKVICTFEVESIYGNFDSEYNFNL